MMKQIVVLTGAGMSAESGLKTFRGSDGLWEEHKLEDVCTPQGWKKNPELVLDFYNKRRRQAMDSLPNAGHRVLANLEKDFEVEIITQNVDNLHELAGSTHVLHLHGELNKARSCGDEHLIYELNEDNWEMKKGDVCEKGYQLRPHIVWFGEAVPAMDEAIKLVKKADLLVIIGTSLNVYPAASLVNYLRPTIPVYLIDPEQVNCRIPNPLTVIQKGASEGVALLIEELKIKFATV